MGGSVKDGDGSLPGPRRLRPMGHAAASEWPGTIPYPNVIKHRVRLEGCARRHASAAVHPSGHDGMFVLPGGGPAYERCRRTQQQFFELGELFKCLGPSIGVVVGTAGLRPAVLLDLLIEDEGQAKPQAYLVQSLLTKLQLPHARACDSDAL